MNLAEACHAVSNVEKTMARVLRGQSDANINFGDLRRLLYNLGFSERIQGSHHIFSREGVAEILNLQPKGSKAKAYQVRQVRGVILAYHFAGEAHEEGPDEETQEGHE